MESRLPKIKSIVKQTANWVIRIMGSLILLFLVWYAMRTLQYMLPVAGHEDLVEIPDSVIRNLAAAALILLLYAVLTAVEKKAGDKITIWCKRIAVTLGMLWQGIAGLCWVLAVDRVPSADQASVIGAAIDFIQGDYGTLAPDHYCGLYAHQLGPAATEEMLFRILGEADYHVIQIVFVLLNVAGIYCIYGILKEVSGRLAVVAMGTLLAGSCMASVFYTSWVYGEIPWVFCSLFSAWMLVRYIKYGKTGSLVGIVTALTLGTLLRKNTLVLVVAYCMVGAVRIFSKWDRRLLISLVLALALPLLCYQGIYKMYEMRSGMEHSRGLPTSAYLYLGMEEIGGRYGWYYSDCWAQYYATDCNTEQSDQIYREMMQERMQAMKAQPGYLRGFYQGKLLSQWNVPTYQSLYFNFNHGDVYHEKLAALEDRLSGDLFDSVVRMADRLQFIIYLGCLFYFIFCVRKDSEITQHLLAVAVIGGFLFSIFWEAKARYMYAYYMMMFPLAALGYKIIRLAEKYFFSGRKDIIEQVSKIDDRGCFMQVRKSGFRQMPDNVWVEVIPRLVQQRYTGRLLAGKGGKAVKRDYRPAGNRRSHVNPIRSKTKQRAIDRPGLLSGRSLDAAGDSRVLDR